MKRVLVLSPHPDDETLGCGGTLRKHVLEGHQVRVIFLTSGERGGHGRPVSLTRRLREQEARQAGRILGIRHLEFWRAPDGALRASQDLAERLRRTLQQWRPHCLYVTHDQEMHPDHRSCLRLVRRAFSGRNAPDRTRTDILMYEVWTPLQRMDEIIEITPYLKAKRAAIQAYRSQCAVVGFAEAILGLNRYRGEMHSWPEGLYAEVFAKLSL